MQFFSLTVDGDNSWNRFVHLAKFDPRAGIIYKINNNLFHV